MIVKNGSFVDVGQLQWIVLHHLANKFHSSYLVRKPARPGRSPPPAQPRISLTRAEWKKAGLSVKVAWLKKLWLG